MPSPIITGAGDEFLEAAQSGDRRALLKALRDHIASRIAEGVAARDLAALSRQLRDVDKELAVLDANADDDDELSKRRADKLGAAASGVHAAKRR